MQHRLNYYMDASFLGIGQLELAAGGCWATLDCTPYSEDFLRGAKYQVVGFRVFMSKDKDQEQE